MSALIERIIPADHVRRHPEMYWNGNPSPGPDDVNAAVIDQLREDGCREIEIYLKGELQLVFCELDWARVVSARFGSIARLFESAVGVPGVTAGGLRVEWLVAVLVAAVRVWVDGQMAYSQGSLAPEFDESTARELRGRVCIAYRLRDS